MSFPFSVQSLMNRLVFIRGASGAHAGKNFLFLCFAFDNVNWCNNRILSSVSHCCSVQIDGKDLTRVLGTVGVGDLFIISQYVAKDTISFGDSYP